MLHDAAVQAMQQKEEIAAVAAGLQQNGELLEQEAHRQICALKEHIGNRYMGPLLYGAVPS